MASEPRFTVNPPQLHPEGAAIQLHGDGVAITVAGADYIRDGSLADATASAKAAARTLLLEAAEQLAAD